MTILVRAARESDRDGIAEIYERESVVRQTGQVPHRGAEFWADFYRVRVPEGRTELVAELDGKIVGHLGIVTGGSPRTRHSASFGISVHEAFHGRGIGKALMAEMTRLADNYLNLVRLELVVHTDNLAAIALYEKFGFEREGLARFDIFTAGRYRHGLRMARINPNYLPMLSDEGA